MVLVDFSQIMYASLFAMSKGGAIVDNDLVRHVVYNTLRTIKSRHGMKYGRMVLCMDSSNPWRNDVFPLYKAKRKADRKKKADPKMDAMFVLMKEIQNDLELLSPYPCVQVDRCEADDIIGTICIEFKDELNILIVSNDKDFYQLHCAGVQQYHNCNGEKQVTQFENPTEKLCELIAKGDTSDGIPNVLSDDDVFVVEGKRQKPMTRKKLLPIMEALNPECVFSTTDVLDSGIKRNVDRNRTLIDLECIPAKYKADILATLDKTCTDTYAITNRATIFHKHLLSKGANILADDIHEFMIGESNE